MAWLDPLRTRFAATAGLMLWAAASAPGCDSPEPRVDTTGCYHLSQRSDLMPMPVSGDATICISVADEPFTSIANGRVRAASVDGEPVSFEPDVDDLVPIRLPGTTAKMDRGYHHLEVAWEADESTGEWLFTGSTVFRRYTERVSFMIGVTVEEHRGATYSAVAGHDQILRHWPGGVDVISGETGRAIDGFSSDATISVVPAADGAVLRVLAAGKTEFRVWNGSGWTVVPDVPADVSVSAVDGESNVLGVDDFGTLVVLKGGSSVEVTQAAARQVVPLDAGWMVAVDGGEPNILRWLTVSPDGRASDSGVSSSSSDLIDFVGRWDGWSGRYTEPPWLADSNDPILGTPVSEGSGWLSGGMSQPTVAQVPEWMAESDHFVPVQAHCAGQEWVLVHRGTYGPQVLVSRRDPSMYLHIRREIYPWGSTCVHGFGFVTDSQETRRSWMQGIATQVLVPIRPGAHWILPPP